MRRTLLAIAMGTAVAGCSEVVPTSTDDALLPTEPVTVEVRLPWDRFGSGLQVFGGFATPAELGSGIAARDFAGSLDAFTLTRFSGYPAAATVVDTTGATRADSAITFVGGRVVARLDTLSSTNEGPVVLTLGALQQVWDARTATWELRIDSIGNQQPWEEPGAGPVTPLGTATWDPAAGDTVMFSVDSAQVAAWADTADLSRGVRLGLVTEGERVKVRDVLLRLDVRSSLNPDTALVLSALRQELTFVYAPAPSAAVEGIRVGGTPSFRTVLDLEVPDRLDGPSVLCAAVGCPVELGPEQVNYAALVLRTRAGDPAFQPTDTVNLDLRAVLQRSALPKSPLGGSLTSSLGRRLAPELFGEDAGTAVEVPLTEFVRDLLRGETVQGTPAPGTVALLSTFEPLSLAYATFHGPGGPLEPQLKLIVTFSSPVQLP